MSFSERFGLKPMTSDFRFQLKLNPFTDDFLRGEIDFYDLPGPYVKGKARVGYVVPQGNLDDYLNKNWRIVWNPEHPLRVPALWIGGEMWMSLTYMEIQSAYVALVQSGGVVGTAGLGLGYFPLRAASNPEVDEVHVYETNPDVIEFFMTSFGKRPEMEKITIHEGDVRKLALYDKEKREPRFDIFFMDVYKTMLPQAVIEDIHLFDRKVAVDTYRFWGEERVILDSFMARERPRMVSEVDRVFLDTWAKTPMDPNDPELADTLLPEIYEVQTDPKYRKAVLEPLGML